MATVQLVDLKSIVQTILNDREAGLKLDDAKVKYEEFAEKYPFFIEMLFSDSLNMNQLNFILSKYEDIREGKQSIEEASVDVGQVFFDEYVKPDLKEPTK